MFYLHAFLRLTQNIYSCIYDAVLYIVWYIAVNLKAVNNIQYHVTVRVSIRVCTYRYFVKGVVYVVCTY